MYLLIWSFWTRLLVNILYSMLCSPCLLLCPFLSESTIPVSSFTKPVTQHLNHPFINAWFINPFKPKCRSIRKPLLIFPTWTDLSFIWIFLILGSSIELLSPLPFPLLPFLVQPYKGLLLQKKCTSLVSNLLYIRVGEEKCLLVNNILIFLI